MSNQENNANLPQGQALEHNIPGQDMSPDVAREVSRMQGMIVSAKRFPRDEDLALKKILKACERTKLAESSMYSYARGGSDITGPSIRLAEAAAKYWGNLQYGIREISQEGGESAMEAFCWDLETNTLSTKSFKIPHKRHTRKGVKTLTDPRDIYELTANFGARRLRACILAVIPQDVMEEATEACTKTLQKGDGTPFADRVAGMIAHFEKSGITQEMISKRIQKNIEAMSEADFVSLKKIFVSLRDGMSKPGDWFDYAKEQSEGSQDLTEKFKKEK